MKENRTLKKLNIAKRLVFCTILVYIAVFLAMNTSYFTRDNLHRVVFSIKQALSGEEPEELVFDDTGGNTYAVFKGGLAVMTDRALLLYDSSGYLLSETGINFYSPVLRTSADRLICFDRGGSGLMVFDSFGVVRQKEFKTEDQDLSILDVQFGDGDRISVITNSLNSKGTVNVYTSDLEELYAFSSVDAYPVWAQVKEKNQLFVAAISPRREVSDLCFYRIDYKTGDGYQTPVYSAEDRFPVCFYSSSNGLSVLTDADLLFAGKDGLTVRLPSISPATERYVLSEKWFMTSSVVSASGRESAVNCFDLSGSLVFSVNFYDLRDIFCGNGLFLVLAEDQLHFLDQTGSILYTQPLSLSGGKIVSDGETVYVIGTGVAEKIEIPAESR